MSAEDLEAKEDRMKRAAALLVASKPINILLFQQRRVSLLGRERK